MRKKWVAAALGVAAFAMTSAGPAAAATGNGCPSVGTNWEATGPFSVTTMQSGVGHTVYRPAALGSQGCARHPVIIWGNGTFAIPGVYSRFLRHLASHGAIVVAANTTQSGSGVQMLHGLDYIEFQNGNPFSVFYRKVDVSKVIAMGHSQGGGGAISAGDDPRVDSTVPIQPGPIGTIHDLHGPAFFLGGEEDDVVPPETLIEPRYELATHIPAVYGVLAGADHLEPTGDGGGFRGPVTAWVRFWLHGDEQARPFFFGSTCTYCTSPAWSVWRRNARALAIPAA